MISRRGLTSGGSQAALAAVCFVVIAFGVGWPAVVGTGALGPQIMIDRDPLYGGPGATGHPVDPPSDPTPIALDLPRDLAIARGLRDGRLDQWNPRAAFGTPLWAELGGPFFPLKAFFYAWPTDAGYAAFLLLRLACAGFGTYLLVRRRGGTLHGGLAAGVVFQLSNPLLYQAPFGVYSNTFVLPWVILAADALAANPRATTAVATSVALGIAASAGHAGIGAVVTAAFFAAMAGHLLAARRLPRRLLAILGWTAVAAGLGLAFAAPTLLPTAELVGSGASYKYDPFGQVLRERFLDNTRYAAARSLTTPFAGWYLLGFASVGVAALGIVGGGVDLSLAAVGLLGLLLSTAPVGFRWINELPGVTLVTPAYALPLLVLPIAVAAGRGIDALATVSVRRLAFAAATPVLAWSALYLLCIPVVLPRPLVPAQELLLTSLVVAATLLPAVALRGRVAGGILPALLVLAMAVECTVRALPLLRQPASTVLRGATPKAVRFIREQSAGSGERMVGVPYGVGYPSTAALFGLNDARNFAAFPAPRYAEYLEAVDAAAPRKPHSNIAARTVLHDVRTARSPLLDVAAVRWVAVPRSPTGAAPPLLAGDPRMTLAASDRTVLIYENHAALPRLRIAYTTVPLADHDAALQWARRVGAAGGHARDLALDTTVFLEPDAAGTPAPRLGGGPADPSDDVRWIDTSAPDRLSIDVRLSADAVVVVADTYDLGWRAWVDGKAAPIHPANLLFRGVPVHAGTHTVEMRYAPRGFRVGLLLWLSAGAACILLIALARFPSSD